MDDDTESDQRLEHQRSSPPEFLQLDALFALTGVEYFKVSGKSNINVNLKCLGNLFWKSSNSRFDKERCSAHSYAFFSIEVVKIPCADQYLKSFIDAKKELSQSSAVIDDVLWLWTLKSLISTFFISQWFDRKEEASERDN